MTIAAGFVARDGIVICADTQETVGDLLKINSPKVLIRPSAFIPGGPRIVFAGAGHGPFIDKLANEAWKRVATKDRKADFAGVCDEIECSIKDTHEEFGRIYQSGAVPNAELLYAVAVAGHTALFRATGPIVNPVEHYGSVGIGFYLADYIHDRLGLGAAGLADSGWFEILAVYLLQQAKDYISGCGEVISIERDWSCFSDSTNLYSTAASLGWSERLCSSGSNLQFSLPRRQPLERQRISRDHVAQRIEEQIVILAAVESERHFVQIGSEMFCAHAMPRPDYSPLEQGERGFDGVGVNVATNVLFRAVVHCLMPDCSDCVFVGVEIVREDHVHILTDVVFDVVAQCARRDAVRMEKTQIAAALTNTDHDFLLPPCFSNSNTALASANPGFIHFDSTVQHWPLTSLFHGATNTMAEIPRGFVADSNRPLHLICGETLTCFYQEQRSGEPRFQRQMRVIENRASGHAELVITLFAVEQLFLSRQLDYLAAAAGAFGVIRPAQTTEYFAALQVGIKHVVNV